MSTAILSRIKALGLTPPFKTYAVGNVEDASGLCIAATRDSTTATLLADALNEACREEGGQWVKCSPETMPEIGAFVWFYVAGGEGPGFVLSGWRAFEGRFWSEGTAYDVVTHNVTHWRYLEPRPQPPTTQPKEERR